MSCQGVNFSDADGCRAVEHQALLAGHFAGQRKGV